MDRNGDGSIDAADLHAALEKVRLGPVSVFGMAWLWLFTRLEPLCLFLGLNEGVRVAGSLVGRILWGRHHYVHLCSYYMVHKFVHMYAYTNDVCICCMYLTVASLTTAA
jgi:hypothetical protein